MFVKHFDGEFKVVRQGKKYYEEKYLRILDKFKQMYCLCVTSPRLSKDQTWVEGKRVYSCQRFETTKKYN